MYLPARVPNRPAKPADGFTIARSLLYRPGDFSDYEVVIVVDDGSVVVVAVVVVVVAGTVVVVEVVVDVVVVAVVVLVVVGGVVVEVEVVDVDVVAVGWLVVAPPVLVGVEGADVATAGVVVEVGDGGREVTGDDVLVVVGGGMVTTVAGPGAGATGPGGNVVVLAKTPIGEGVPEPGVVVDSRTGAPSSSSSIC